MFSTIRSTDTTPDIYTAAAEVLAMPAERSGVQPAKVRSRVSGLAGAAETTLTLAVSRGGVLVASPTVVVPTGVTAVDIETDSFLRYRSQATTVTLLSDQSGDDSGVSVTCDLLVDLGEPADSLHDDLIGAWLTGPDLPTTGGDSVLDESGGGNSIFNQTATFAPAGDRMQFRDSIAKVPNFRHAGYSDPFLHVPGESQTIGATIRRVTDQDLAILLYSQGDSSSRATRLLYLTANDALHWACTSVGPTYQSLNGPADLTLGADVPCLVCREADRLVVYMEGATAETAFTGTPLAITGDANHATLGRDYNSVIQGDFDLSRLMVWRRSLTEAERQAYFDGWTPTQRRSLTPLRLIGVDQSNNEGKDGVSPAGREVRNTRNLVMDSPRAGESGGQGVWEGLRAPWDGASASDNFSPFTLALALLPSDVVAYRLFDDGTSIQTDWADGGVTWTAAQGGLTRFEAAIAGNGIAPTDTIIVMGLGEAAAAADLTDWDVKAEDLVDRIKAEIGVETVGVVVHQLSDNQLTAYPTGLAAVKADQAAFVAADATHRRLVTTDDLPTKVGDEPHFTYESLRTIGERDNTAIRELRAVLAAEREAVDTSAIATAVEAAIINEGDAAAVLGAIADRIAADWVEGDASPLAIVAAMKSDATLAQMISRIDAAVTTRSSQVDLAGLATVVGAIQDVLPAGGRDIAGAGDTAANLDQVSGGGSGATVRPRVVIKSKVWSYDPLRSSSRPSDLVSVRTGATPWLAFEPALNPGTSVTNITSVEIDGSSSGVDNLGPSADYRQGVFQVTTPLTAGTKEVTATLTTSDGQTVPVVGTLVVD